MSGSGSTMSSESITEDTYSNAEEISDNELPDYSFTFSCRKVSLNIHKSSRSSTTTTRVGQIDLEEGSNANATITLLDSSADTETETVPNHSNESIILPKRLNETLVKYNVESDSILFSKTPSTSGSENTVQKSKACKRKANDEPAQHCSKRMKAQEQVVASTSDCTALNANTPGKKIENDSIQEKQKPQKNGSIVDARGHKWVPAPAHGSNAVKITSESSTCLQTHSPITSTSAGLLVGNSARGHSLISTNAYNFGPDMRRVRGNPRPIVIDGSNVAMAHGNNLRFSCRGIQLCATYFARRGHSKIVAFVPQYRHKRTESVDTFILDDLQKEGILKFTPSREIGRQRFVPYDDRYILQYAHDTGAIIVSNDNYRDLYDEKPLWRDTIRNRVLSFTWVDENYLIFPQDPLGRYGPTLDKFLLF